jgi:hypothetical protein
MIKGRMGEWVGGNGAQVIAYKIYNSIIMHISKIHAKFPTEVPANYGSC